MDDMGRQMEALDDFVAKARSQNGHYRDAHLATLDSMSTGVRESYTSVQERVDGLNDRINQFKGEAAEQHVNLGDSVVPLLEDVCKPLSNLKSSIQNRSFEQYVSTGVTPWKRKYEYPSALPSTESHEALKSRLRTTKDMEVLPFNDEQYMPGTTSPTGGSPSKGFVYNDAEDEVGAQAPAVTNVNPSNTGLREVDANVAARPLAHSTEEASTEGQGSDGPDVAEADGMIPPPSKRRRSNSAAAETKMPNKMLARRMAGMMEGRENVPPPGVSGGRRLRGRPSP